MSVATFSRPLYVYGPGIYSPQLAYLVARLYKRRSVDLLSCTLISGGSSFTKSVYFDVHSYPVGYSVDLYGWLAISRAPQMIPVSYDDMVLDVDTELDYSVDPNHTYLIVAYGQPNAVLQIYAYGQLLKEIKLIDVDGDGKALEMLAVNPLTSFTMRVVPNGCRFSMFSIPRFEYSSSLITVILSCTELAYQGGAYQEVDTIMSSVSRNSVRLYPKPSASVSIEWWEAS